MKAVVLEVRGKEAVVLTTDGEIIRIRQKNLTTGDTIELSEKQAKGKVISYREILQYGSIAAAAALFLGCGGLYSYNNVMACSYVSLDSTPSIEYTLNRKNLVLDVTALNDEATEIVQELKSAGIKKNTMSEVMEKTAQLLEKYGYLDTDATDYVLINISSDDEKLRNLLKEEANTVFDNINTDNEENVNVTVTESSVSDRKNAKALGISSGEYQEIQRIKENETAAEKPTVSADDIDKYSGLEVRELLENSGRLEKRDESFGENKEELYSNETKSNSGSPKNTNTDGQSESNLSTQKNADGDKQTELNSNNQKSADTDKQTKSNSDNQTKSNLNNQKSTDADRQTESNSDNQKSTNGDRQTKSNSDNQKSTDADRQTESNSDNQKSTNGDRQTESNSDNQTKSNSNNQKSAEADKQTETYSGNEPGQNIALPGNEENDNVAQDAIQNSQMSPIGRN